MVMVQLLLLVIISLLNIITTITTTKRHRLQSIIIHTLRNVTYYHYEFFSLNRGVNFPLLEPVLKKVNFTEVLLRVLAKTLARTTRQYTAASRIYSPRMVRRRRKMNAVENATLERERERENRVGNNQRSFFLYIFFFLSIFFKYFL